MDDPATNLMRRVFEGYRERDFDALIALTHPDIVAVVTPPLGARQTYRGRQEVLAMLRDGEAQGVDYQAEARTFTLVADAQVFAEGWLSRKPAGSGQGFTQAFYWLCEVRDDKIVRWEAFTDRREARAAAGLELDPSR